MACVGGPRPAGARVGEAICRVAASPARRQGCCQGYCQGWTAFLRFLRKQGSEGLHRQTRLWGNTGATRAFSRSRLISEASLPVFQRGWGRTCLDHFSTSVRVTRGWTHKFADGCYIPDQAVIPNPRSPRGLRSPPRARGQLRLYFCMRLVPPQGASAKPLSITCLSRSRWRKPYRYNVAVVARTSNFVQSPT